MFQSQNYIEVYLDQLFKKPGIFLEIGCWDGQLISQTAYLEREHGWTGVCVDPFPHNFENRTCQVCAMAVAAEMGEQEFVKVSIDRANGGDVSYLSGFRKDLHAHWSLIEASCNYEIVQVPCITIPRLYETYKLPDHVNFMSLDTEGSELEILSSIDFSKYSYDLIMYEHNRDEAARSKMSRLLETNGYLFLASTDIDDLFLRRDFHGVAS